MPPVDPAGAARLVAGAGAGFDCYSGDDSLTLPLLAVGAVGVVSVASHWVGQELGEMSGSTSTVTSKAPRELNAALLDAVSFQSSDEAPNPLPAKAVLRVLGLPAGECRLPMGPAPDWLGAEGSLHARQLGLMAHERSARSGVTGPHA